MSLIARALERFQYYASYWSAWAAFTLGWGYRRGGWRHCPETGPLLIVSNHQSFIDPLFIGLAASRPLTYLARSSLFKNRLFAAVIRSWGAVPIDRGYGREGLQTVLDQLALGRAVLMFPEGERTHDGTVQEMKAGITLILKKTDAVILPCGVAGAFAVWPRTATRPKPAPPFLADNGGSIGVSFGEPLPPGFYKGMDRDAILTDLRARITAAHEDAERIRRKPPHAGAASGSGLTAGGGAGPSPNFTA